MNNKLPLLIILLLSACPAMAQSAEAQIRAAPTASSEVIARHDVDGIVRDMMPDYSIVTGRGQHMQGRDSLLACWQKTLQYPDKPYSEILRGNTSW